MILNFQKNRGFSMIELLVTILVFSIGMLGIASLQTTGMRLTRDAELMGQASIFANNMADRIRGNITFSNSYDDVNGTDRTCLDEGSATPAPTCSVAQEEIIQWNEDIGSVLPGGSGIVSVDDTTYSITITWIESQDSNQVNSERNYSMAVRL